MGEHRALFERAGSRYAESGLSTERLLLRRSRRERNRRIRAGALGLVVTLAMGALVARSMTSDRIPADHRRPVPAAPGTLAYALDGGIYVADGDGSNAVKILDWRSAEDCYGWSGEYWAEGPMWSPDGRYLAFRRFTDCGGKRPYPRVVVISDADGNVIATFSADGWGISWSPDSSRVAVWDRLPDTIGVYGLDGVRQAQLTMPDWWRIPGDVDPGWMPDGASVYVDPNVVLPLDGGAAGRHPAPSDPAGDTDGFDIGVDHGALKLARTDGSGAVTLVAAERGTHLEAIGVSPEGDRVLFSKIEDGEPSLWSIGVDGSDPRLLVGGTTQGDWLLE
jgi:Tol biopolymer transport system component